MAQRYRRKPIEVEAVQFDGSRECADRITQPHGYVMWIVEDDGPDDGPLTIGINAGTSGVAYALASDWIVREAPVAGYRVYDAADFAELFEPVD